MSRPLFTSTSFALSPQQLLDRIFEGSLPDNSLRSTK